MFFLWCYNFNGQRVYTKRMILLKYLKI